MSEQESHKHHFVPEFVMKPWASDGTLNGYWWNCRTRELACKRLGPGAFCNELDLLLLERHPERRDILEDKFFGGVDSRGARARDEVLEKGPSALGEEQRCDIVRLLFSLEVRSPKTVESIRTAVGGLVESIDGDSELRDAMGQEGLSALPSDWYAQQLGHTIGDRSFVNVIQHLVDNAKVGGKLINARWSLVRLSDHDGTFVLSDCPVVRLPDRGGWFLPLEPMTALAILPHPLSIDRSPAHRVAKRLNVASTRQAQKFVFSVEKYHERWLKRHLDPRTSGTCSGAHRKLMDSAIASGGSASTSARGN